MATARFSYRIMVILRILLILFFGFAGVVIATLTPYWLISAWLGLFVILLAVELIRYHERSKKVLREFLHSIEQDDFSSISIADEKDADLQSAYQKILDKFRFLRIEKETHYHYLQRVIEHVDTALICFDTDEQIQLVNRAAKELLGLQRISDLMALEKIDNNLVWRIRKLKTGQREMIRVIRDGRILNLSIRGTEFKLKQKKYKIVSLHDIKPELDEQEVDSWQKLVRVLTHEIMNSTIPITNLVGFAREFLVDEEGHPKKIPGLKEEEIKDLVESLTTAESRSQGLVNFVQTTKSLTKIPEPSLSEISIDKLFSRLKELFKHEMEQKKIECKLYQEKPDMVFHTDVELIEQVLINLIRNAIDALKDTKNPVIEINAHKNHSGSLAISIKDNGQGIDKESLENIFVPFFSTKKEGSGIGLSLSRQIMHKHKGRIDVESEPGKGSCFTLEF
jgi:two-component system nitrogen regulation sensor histidine kinase NtrY